MERNCVRCVRFINACIYFHSFSCICATTVYQLSSNELYMCVGCNRKTETRGVVRERIAGFPIECGWEAHTVHTIFFFSSCITTTKNVTQRSAVHFVDLFSCISVDGVAQRSKSGLCSVRVHREKNGSIFATRMAIWYFFKSTHNRSAVHSSVHCADMCTHFVLFIFQQKQIYFQLCTSSCTMYDVRMHVLIPFYFILKMGISFLSLHHSVWMEERTYSRTQMNEWKWKCSYILHFVRFLLILVVIVVLHAKYNHIRLCSL